MFCPSGLCPLVELSSWPWFSLYVGVSVECFALRYCFAIQTNLRDVFCLQRRPGCYGCLLSVAALLDVVYEGGGVNF